jgi:hypothetical protein
MGLRKSSNKLHVYDAGYIKLREASLTYNFSAETLGKLPHHCFSFNHWKKSMDYR